MRLLAGIICALIMGGQAGTAVGAPEPPEPLTVTTLNVHGSRDRHGGGNGGAVTAMRADILRIVKERKPDVIALQELCYRQHRALRTSLAALGYSATMTYTRRTSGCNDRARGNRFGNALYVKGPIKWRASHSLPWGASRVGSTGREPRRVLCAEVAGWGRLVCTTHLSPTDPDRANQARTVKRVVDVWAKGKPYVVAADFNQYRAPVLKWFGGTVSGQGIDLVVSDRARLAGVDEVPSSDHPAVTVKAS